MAREWDEFTHRLILAGLKFSECSDELVWSLIKLRGNVTAILAYNALSEQYLSRPDSW